MHGHKSTYMSPFILKFLREWRCYNLFRNIVLQSDGFILPSIKMQLCSEVYYFHSFISQTQNAISHVTFWKAVTRYRVCHYGRKIGITTCTTATLTNFFTIFLRTSMKYTWNGTGTVTNRFIQVKNLNHHYLV